MGRRLAAVAGLAGFIFGVHPAQAITFAFNWVGDGGYSTEGLFRYDASIANGVISESGAGPTHGLQSLSVSFFNPAHTLLESFNTVSGGVSSSAFFQFNFDTSTLNLTGPLNVGGGTGVIGEKFFNGTIGGLLRLRQDIDQQGNSFEIDRQNIGVVTVIEVPEAGVSVASWSVLGLGVAWGLARWRRSQ